MTTLGSERRHNDLLAGALDDVQPISDDEFQSRKREVDAQIDDENNSELVCGHILDYAGVYSSSVDVEPDELADFFVEHRHSTFIDVREPHEFRFTQDWDLLGFETPPKNIPLTRLANFLSHLLAEEDFAEREIIFICRSGNRSAKAAQVLRRLGMSRAWHVAGGLALGTLPSREVVAADELEYAI